MPPIPPHFPYQAVNGSDQVGRPWRPGFRARLPIWGFLALVGATLCGIAAAIVLAVSNGIALNSWKLFGVDVQPTVLLSIFSTLANALLAYAFSSGATIAWWIKALRGGSIGGLHRYWKYSDSMTAVLTPGRHFNTVALASVLMTIALIDGPLLQRASTVTTRQVLQNVTLEVPISSGPFIKGATGVLADHDELYAPSLFNPIFTNVIRQYNARTPINVSAGCNGTCDTTLLAAGWDVSCSSTTERYHLMTVEDLIQSQAAAYNSSISYNGPAQSQTMFNVDVVFNGGADVSQETEIQGNSIRIVAKYKSDPGDNGTIVTENCLLREAIVHYPIQLVNNTLSIRSPQNAINTTTTSQIIVRDPDTNGQSVWPSTCGGIWLALHDAYTATANLTAVGGWMRMTTADPTARTYLEADTAGDLASSAMYWSSPMREMISMLREISLRAAISTTIEAPTFALTQSNATENEKLLTANYTDIVNPNMTQVRRTLQQTVPATQNRSLTVYESHIGFGASGVSVIMLAVFGIIPIFRGWWKLGRPVSMSPIEIAKAFEAPLMDGIDSNATPEELVRGSGRQRVRYSSLSGGKLRFAREKHELGHRGSGASSTQEFNQPDTAGFVPSVVDLGSLTGPDLGYDGNDGLYPSTVFHSYVAPPDYRERSP